MLLTVDMMLTTLQSLATAAKSKVVDPGSHIMMKGDSMACSMDIASDLRDRQQVP